MRAQRSLALPMPLGPDWTPHGLPIMKMRRLSLLQRFPRCAEAISAISDDFLLLSDDVSIGLKLAALMDLLRLTRHLELAVERARHVPGRRVYFVRSPATGLIKIGSSNDPHARVAALRTASGCELELLATMPGDFEQEFALHERFATSRRFGEWFEATDELMRYIAKAQPKKGRRR